MTYQSFREKVNLRIYYSRDRVLLLLRWSSFMVAIAALSTLIYSYGFPLDAQSRDLPLWIIRCSLGFYVLHYALRIIYTFDVPAFLRESWLEGVLMIWIVVDGTSSYLFNFPLVEVMFAKFGFHNVRPLYLVFVQVYLLLIVGIELNKTTFVLFFERAGPVRILIISYLFWIGLGAGLLMLPECGVGAVALNVNKALFTSMSAVTLCGLTVVDIAATLTFKGQLVLLFLMQIGLINILVFATYMSSQFSSGSGIRKQALVEDFQSADRLFSKEGVLRQIFGICLLIEVLGTIGIYMLWPKEMVFATVGDKLYSSFFHAVSAFSNTGFSLYTGGIRNPLLETSYVLHLMIAILVFLGGLGYLPLLDLFGISNLRTRLRLPWKRVAINTRIALYSAIFMAIAGGVLFFLLEKENSLVGRNYSEAGISALFMAINRSCAFSTVDFSKASQSVVMLMLFLMFVGGASGSVAGGVKTSTFTAILLSATATIRGKKDVQFERHVLSFDIFSRSFSIVIFMVGAIVMGAFILCLTDPNWRVLQLLMAEMSAITLSGQSGTPVSEMSAIGQAVLMASMIVGRVGLLLLLNALGRKQGGQRFHYPRAQIMVG
ncbi:MAG: hypothetical protein KDD54_08970 [Flavobacteriales bacterium]|nr:hypothetical protein [Flavobacteriales bacterium]